MRRRTSWRNGREHEPPRRRTRRGWWVRGSRGEWRRVYAGPGPVVSEELPWSRELLTRLGDNAELLEDSLHGGPGAYGAQNILVAFVLLFAVLGIGTFAYMLLRPCSAALSRRLRIDRQRALRGDERMRKLLRRGRVFSKHPPPTGEELEALWDASRPRNALAEKLRLGARIADLEPIVDRSHIRDENGGIVGRKPGVKGWIWDHCPRLLAHYKSLMAYKLLAEKFARSCGNPAPGDTAQEAMATNDGRSLLAANTTLRSLGAALDTRLGIEPRRRRFHAA